MPDQRPPYGWWIVPAFIICMFAWAAVIWRAIGGNDG